MIVGMQFRVLAERRKGHGVCARLQRARQAIHGRPRVISESPYQQYTRECRQRQQGEHGTANTCFANIQRILIHRLRFVKCKDCGLELLTIFSGIVAMRFGLDGVGGRMRNYDSARAILCLLRRWQLSSNQAPGSLVHVKSVLAICLNARVQTHTR